MAYLRLVLAVIFICMYPWRIFYMTNQDNWDFLTAIVLWAHHFTTAAYVLLVIQHAQNGDYCGKMGGSNATYPWATIFYQFAVVGQVFAFILTLNGLSGTKKLAHE